MKQIYDFAAHEPPRLTQGMLLAELKQRQLKRQTILIGIAGGLLQIILLLSAWLLSSTYPRLSLFCLIYMLISASGSSLIAIAYKEKGGIC